MIIVSNGLLLSESLEQPLTHARIGYQRISGDVTASSAASGFPASAADNPLTYTGWKPTSVPAWWEIDAGKGVEVDYVGIAAHNLGTIGATVKPQYSTGGSPEWEDATDEHMPADNRPIMFLFEEQFASKFRIYIEVDGSPAEMPFVGVVYIGKALAMQRAIYGGHSPVTLSRETTIRPTVSERGQWLGRSIIRGGFVGSWTWRHLNADWYREHFDRFVKAARERPFFIAWRPETFPNEVAYCWTQKDIVPSNMGIKDFMQVTVEAVGVE